MLSNRILATTAALALVFATATTANAQIQGPSSSQTPYVVPVATGVKTVSILTVGDSVNLKPDGTPYRMVGIPDGLGLSANGQGTFDLLMNHELGATAGIVRAHGSAGAFVSLWKIQSRTLRVIKGEDLIQEANLTTGSGAFARFCSGDLAPRGTFYDPNTHMGTKELIYLNGEENGSDGRAMAHIASGELAGTSYELPALGKFAWENCVANPSAGLKTLVMGTDDSTPGQVYLYVGTKLVAGSPVDQAGLTNGSLFGIKVPGVPLEDRLSGIGSATRFELGALGNVSAMNGTQIQNASNAAGVTQFLRPEDGAWDPSSPRDFYFVTTDRFATATTPARSRLWRLRFDDLNHPEQGGSISIMLDGTEGQQMLDNIAIDGSGHVLLQEDPGNQSHIARVWQYTIATDELKLIAQHDPQRFVVGAPMFLTQDEESSGIVDASAALGQGWFLLDVQAHYGITGELVEGGQLLALYNPDSAR